MNPVSTLETKIPPPVWGLITAAFMWWQSQIFPSLALIPKLVSQLSLGLIFLGISIEVAAFLRFRKSKTTINPLKPSNTTDIVVSGLYRYSRNPMYVGMAVLLSGWALYLGNIASLLGIPLFVWVITQLQIRPEERILKAKFGKTYTDYLTQVRRWL